jgi:hypothetical protein
VGYPAEDCWVPDKEKDSKIFVFSTDSNKKYLNKSYDHEKLTKEDSQEVFDLYDDYAHNKIDRRRFVENYPVCCRSSYCSFLT